MNKNFILTSVLFMFLTSLLISCAPSRVYATKERTERPAPNRNFYNTAALIIVPQPGFRMMQGVNGRYYHRNPQGLLYWKGYDNRFYLDKNYFHRYNYSQQEYKEWKNYRKHNRR